MNWKRFRDKGGLRRLKWFLKRRFLIFRWSHISKIGKILRFLVFGPLKPALSLHMSYKNFQISSRGILFRSAKYCLMSSYNHSGWSGPVPSDRKVYFCIIFRILFHNYTFAINENILSKLSLSYRKTFPAVSL